MIYAYIISAKAICLSEFFKRMTSKMRLSQLQELFQQRGLECAGLKKAQVPALLKQADADAAGLASADPNENGSAQDSDEGKRVKRQL